jgi:AcrR family transcriptional regulator
VTEGQTQSTNTEAPTRGRPRSEKSRRAILAAASDLLLDDGLASISMDAVAERAGTSKATIYRWWRSKELLALDVLFSEWQPPEGERPDTGTLSGDLLALMAPWTQQLGEKPYGRVVAALVSRAQDDPRFAEEYRTRFVAPRREQARAIFERAAERREISQHTDVEAALDLLYGPFYHRLLHRHAPLDEGFAGTIVDYVVAALSRPVEQAG